MGRENRLEIYNRYYGEKSNVLERLMLFYDRYYEAEKIYNYINEQVNKLRILDYGAGVGDYGLFFARLQAKVSFYDFKHFIDFIKYRIATEELEGNYFTVEAGEPDFHAFDLIIFGEVLEHLDNPLEVLWKCIEQKVRFIFTSSYPYRSDPDFFKTKGHSMKAYEQQDEFRKVLEKYYFKLANFRGQMNFWLLEDKH